MAELKSYEKQEMRRVGLVYDERMSRHHTPDDKYHPENPNRVRAIWNKLQSAGISQRCVRLVAKEAEDRHILLVHSAKHLKLIKKIGTKKLKKRKRAKTASKYKSIYFNEGSSESAYLAAGSVIEAAERVAKGELNSAVAIVRPPGHHAERDEPMGFCLFNNVAVAASFLLNEKPELSINKILIVDWDIHHGNGTQKMFWEDHRVLFFSVHRHEFGRFYPTNEGSYAMVGEGPGAGYNINVPWENNQCGDADYLAVWDHILVPVTKAFNPDIIIVSAGFHAGDFCVTPHGYSVMLKKLLSFANGKIVLALEGGYDLESSANSMLACVEVLLGHRSVPESLKADPLETTWHVIQAVRQELSAFWPTYLEELPTKLIDQATPPVTTSTHQLDELRTGKGVLKIKDLVMSNLNTNLTNPNDFLEKMKSERKVAREVKEKSRYDSWSSVTPPQRSTCLIDITAPIPLMPPEIQDVEPSWKRKADKPARDKQSPLVIGVSKDANTLEDVDAAEKAAKGFSFEGDRKHLMGETFEVLSGELAIRLSQALQIGNVLNDKFLDELDHVKQAAAKATKEKEVAEASKKILEEEKMKVEQEKSAILDVLAQAIDRIKELEEQLQLKTEEAESSARQLAKKDEKIQKLKEYIVNLPGEAILKAQYELFKQYQEREVDRFIREFEELQVPSDDEDEASEELSATV